MLDLTTNPIDLTRALVDIESPSHYEKNIADAIEQALHAIDNVEVLRHGNTLVARTHRGLGERVILAGHIDTVPIADNVPSHMEGDVMFGCGTVDMKSGMAVYLHAFATLANHPALAKDLTVVCYEGEEVASEYNGLGHVQAAHPDWLSGDLALLGEPSGAVIEAGCQGTIRLRVTGHGVRAHSARSWLGDNAMHKLAPVITNITQYDAQEVLVDGCLYHEGLNIVHCESGVATNTIPDEAWMFVNFRFAPNRSVDEALAHMLEVLDLPEGVTYDIDDAVPGARPGLDRPAAAALLEATGGKFRAKYGWTDVSRFSETGVPAVNFGPGDPAYCHKKDEQCPVSMITEVSRTLVHYLTSTSSQMIGV
ncbi:succinyl-diaminopimelate desuccinylase [Corynebacterium belfantii]|uniref:Succinyl-diaminopimelate desuccinylase n=1 Tax=Corynebacterium belfantii TaxID=2014537 RepID=A0ABS0L8U8_9CORY|nr:succinyl-diaminopimelate desuccinylase [Corynebacterium belfantii]OLN17290.1 succinyl-diaminopimelate desuccinylase [Corynebacterium diphtheriae subsp. lausannense]QVI97961.1 succinyl-diaminopimelate desuccinylase [Corynebacterium diphtheriae]MBG9242718.1 succinyl-diaminopimelate desuccinylase [Corynebacterium belfantii]MBG9258077.1 succinyl-diaminopimelate desuccinylase [Corynebacterium belfantii]MBG9264685.1 succinyl-diaminopimelate desuccinylase [Corynebacterium belfantii]